jgi:antitoxin (DNA-binding transcriptional repressor) of toxin-antitoxin stability system
VRNGEEIIIAKAGEPVARMVPLVNRKNLRIAGNAKGKITIVLDFDAPLPESILKSFKKWINSKSHEFSTSDKENLIC